MTLLNTPAQLRKQILEHPSNLFLLNLFLEGGPSEFCFEEDADLANLMCNNLEKANQDIRLASLKVLRKFKSL